MKFILNYRTELSIFLLVPIHALRWYRFLRYSGTDSCAMMVPFRRYYQQKNETMNKKCSIRTEEHHPGALPLLRAHGFSDRL